MPMKSTIDLHLTPTNANIGVREIKLLGRIRVFLSVQYSTDPVHCTYVVKSNFLDFNNNSSTNKLFTSVLSRQQHKASQLILNARFSLNCYLTIASNSNKRKFSDLNDYHQDTTELFEGPRSLLEQSR